MATNMTVSKRMGVGFGALVVLTVLLGAVAIVQMRSVEARADRLTTKYIPEATLASSVKDSTFRLSLAGRSFALTGQQKYKDEAFAHARALDESLEKAEELVRANPDLVKLGDGLDDAKQAKATYVNLFEESVGIDDARKVAIAQLNEAAAKANTALDAVAENQRQKLAAEIRDSTSKELLLRRAELIHTLDALTESFGLIRVVAFKMQATEDLSLTQELRKHFADANTHAQTLRASFKDSKDIGEIDTFTTALQTYDQASSEVAKTMGALVDITPRRAAASDKLVAVVDEIVSAALVNATTLSRESSSALTFASKILIIGVCGGAVLGVALAYLISRSINNALKRIAGVLSTNSSQVASASTQVSASSQSLAQGASEQAASLEESSSAIEEMASMIKKNADTSQQANVLSDDARRAADAGSEAMNRMSTAIADIERSSQETAKIIKTIDEIAFQTNLLALNAAVEAARAGEAGKGFAVVAEEVRNLAMRSAEAAKNTSSLIEESVGKAKNGVSIAQTVAENLTQINEATVKVTGLIAEIAASSKEQATGIDQITQAVGQMDKVTQTNAANAEETAAASEELSAQAEQLQSCVRDLQVLVGIASTAQRPEPARTGAVGVAAASRHTRVIAAASPSPAERIPLESAPSAGDFSAFSKAA